MKQNCTGGAAASHGLADRWGILDRYVDCSRRVRTTSPETRDALMRAMGVDPERPAPVRLPEVRVLGPDETMRVPPGAELVLEDGARLAVDGRLPPDLPWGYHDLFRPGQLEPALIIKSPGRCWLDPRWRSWGWAAGLYAVRSSRSWGIGDLADLRRLAEWSARLGAGAVLINPLGAVAPVVPQQPSPYFPSSRRFWNPLYLRIEEIPGADRVGVDLDRLADQARQLNHQRRIDRDRVFQLKMEALERIWEHWDGDPAFDRFWEEGGAALHAFAAYGALAERFGGDWRRWPDEYRRCDGPAVDRFVEAHARRVRFHAWLQWLLDRQLGAAAGPLPLVHDLPIGVDPGGMDAWQWQDLLARGATIGAPPDDFNVEGQDWQLPPLVPHRLHAARFRPFIETVRSALRHAGGLRIDHVMGLFRLFWIPEGMSPADGAYVRYPADVLLAIVAVESHRARAWIAGEDLGTVEPAMRRRLAQYRMLSYRVLWFADTPPRAYPELTLAAVTTHDLPTVAGLWSGADLEAQHHIGRVADPTAWRRMRKRLIEATGLDDGAPVAEAIREAYRALGEAPSAMLVASLEDALAVVERPNMPGTRREWPNWSLALPASLEELEASDLARAIATSLSRGA